MASCPECGTCAVTWRGKRISLVLIGAVGAWLAWAALWPVFERAYEHLYPSAEPTQLTLARWGREVLQSGLMFFSLFLLITSWQHAHHDTTRSGLRRYLTPRMVLAALLFCFAWSLGGLLILPLILLEHKLSWPARAKDDQATSS